MFLKWAVVGRVKVGDLPTPPENSSSNNCHQSPCPHGKGFDDSCWTNVSATCSLAFRRCPLAPKLTRFICLLFLSLGLPQIKSLRSKTLYSRRSESFHSRRNCNCATRKRTHVFQIIITLFIFNIKKYVNTKTTCNKCSFDYLH